jgi:hypothetical protein
MGMLLLGVTAEWVTEVDCKDQWWMRFVAATCADAMYTYRKLHLMGWAVAVACGVGTAGYISFTRWATAKKLLILLRHNDG